MINQRIQISRRILAHIIIVLTWILITLSPKSILIFDFMSDVHLFICHGGDVVNLSGAKFRLLRAGV